MAAKKAATKSQLSSAEPWEALLLAQREVLMRILVMNLHIYRRPPDDQYDRADPINYEPGHRDVVASNAAGTRTGGADVEAED